MVKLETCSRWMRPLAAASLVLALAMGVATRADATIVERIVAVVGDKPILLSDLRARARPYLTQIYSQPRPPAELTVAENKMLQELLAKMIDERLESAAAERARISVTTEEIDQGLTNIASQSKLSVREIVDEARKQGLTEQEYREEVRRQLLDSKLIQLRVKGRVRPSEEDARALYMRITAQLSEDPPVDVRLLALRIAPNSSPAEITARETLAAELLQRARDGEDFCSLIARYSEDPETTQKCGSRGPQPLANIIPEVQAIIKDLKPGEFGQPLRFGDQAIVIVQYAGKQKLPEFEDVKDAMLNRAFAESLERQRKVWLTELRRQTYVDVRY
jgi:peptidyl-prolyl cis-trans isomerase SurA